MKKTEDVGEPVSVKLGYMEVVMPFEAAVAFMRAASGGSIARFDRKWVKGHDGGWEVLEDIEVSMNLVSKDRLALAKLNREAYEQARNEQEAA